MPPYPGLRHSMKVNKLVNNTEETNNVEDDPDDWAAQYQEYLDENDVLETEDEDDKKDVDSDDENPEEEDWAVQYARYCEEKESEFFESIKIREEDNLA